MNTTAELPVRADHHARDMLLDTTPGRGELLFRCWAGAMGTAATRAATPAAPSTSVRTLREPLPCLAAFRPTLNWSAAATTVS